MTKSINSNYNSTKHITKDATSIQNNINELKYFGGRVKIDIGAYNVLKTIIVDATSIMIDGGLWCCNTDPNGVFESTSGTKLRQGELGMPIMEIGNTTDPISGAVIKNLGFQGDILGMDTRPLVNFKKPIENSGICLDKVRTDQCEFTKLSFCGLANAICATGNSEIDACTFDKINTDGCGNGFYFAPRASYYCKITNCVCADNPYYGFYLKGNTTLHNVIISQTTFVRNGGAFSDNDNHAAVFFDTASNCEINNCIFDDPGTFWFYNATDTLNDQRKPSHRKTVALRVYGNSNRIKDNTFLNSSTYSIYIKGDGNVLLNNVCDGDVYIDGENNVISNLIFTKDTSKLILSSKAQNSTAIYNLDKSKIIYV